MKSGFVLLLLSAIGLFSIFWDFSPASLKSIDSVVSMAEGSDRANLAIKDFLKKNPNPSNEQRQKLSEVVEAIVVAENSSRITGIPYDEIIAKKEYDNRPFLDVAEEAGVPRWLFIGMTLAVALGLVITILIKFLSHSSRRY